MIPIKNCGNCINFIKLSNANRHSNGKMKNRSGLCECHDWRESSDGKLCQYWKGIKYSRRIKHVNRRKY